MNGVGKVVSECEKKCEGGLVEPIRGGILDGYNYRKTRLAVMVTID